MRKKVLILLCALGPLFAAGRVESGQSRRGWIDAHVLDEQGKAIPDAMVTITNITNGEKQSHRTDKDGYWRFENVSAGTYTVIIEARGFGKLKQPDVEVNSEQGPNLRLTLARAQQPLEGMGGYIDSAIVASQVRIRFEAAFHNNAPDRAEFFYAQWASGNRPTTGTGPNYPGASDDVNFQQLYFQAEYAPVSRFSIFTEVPIRWIEPQHFISNTHSGSETPSFHTLSGISDVRAGLKVTLASSTNHALTFQFKAHAPSGDSSQGLGTDHYSIEPSLLYYQRLSLRWAVESQIGDWHPIGGSKGEVVGTQTLTNFAGDVFLYGIGPSYQLIDREHIRFAPVAELFGWNVRGSLETINPVPVGCKTTQPDCSHDASGTNIINLKVGARTSIGRHDSFYVGFGRAVTHSVWYQEIVRVEYRYSF